MRGFDFTRRDALRLAFAALTTLLAPARALARACRTLVVADAGPFYPTDPIPYADDLITGSLSDLTPGSIVLHVLGRVVDANCAPVVGADVEIWQCDAGGRYDHPNASQHKPLDAGFRYFAKTRSDGDGAFRFRTVRPVSYEAFGVARAPHLHVRVKATGHPMATTELYFSGAPDEALRAGDRVFQGRGPRRGEMIVPVRTAAGMSARIARTPEPGALLCECELTLESGRRS
jgi:protocatechuate 3,4-dioxygenase, beta subunit